MKDKVEELITRTTFRVILDRKRYLCCIIECCDIIKVSMSKEWGFKVRKRSPLWYNVLNEISVNSKWQGQWSVRLKEILE